MKRFLAILMAMLMVFAMFSCKDKEETPDEDDTDTDEKTNYTVTVLDDNGDPVMNAEVTFITSKNVPIPQRTGVDGKASYKTADTMTAKLTKIPEAYAQTKLNQVQSFGADGTLEITLEKLPPYIINVVDEDGNAIAGVQVQMCDESGSCRIPTTTDSEGKGYYNYESGTFHAQLTSLPEGYTLPADAPADGYYEFNIDQEATIELVKVSD